jgi:hypothetical protein
MMTIDELAQRLATLDDKPAVSALFRRLADCCQDEENDVILAALAVTLACVSGGEEQEFKPPVVVIRAVCEVAEFVETIHKVHVGYRRPRRRRG